MAMFRNRGFLGNVLPPSMVPSLPQLAMPASAQAAPTPPPAGNQATDQPRPRVTIRPIDTAGIYGQPAPTGKREATAQQVDTAGQADRMIQLHARLKALEAAGYSPESVSNQAGNLAEGLGMTGIGRMMRTDMETEYRQVLYQFAEAFARARSGADMRKDEADRFIDIFGLKFGMGDTGVQQVQRARELAINEALISAGPAWQWPSADAPPDQQASPQASANSGVAAPKSEAEYNALPSGTKYLHPDGRVKTKP